MAYQLRMMMPKLLIGESALLLIERDPLVLVWIWPLELDCS